MGWVVVEEKDNDARVLRRLALTAMSYRFARDRPRFTDTLDVIKFLCKDLWMLVFRKQIDNLKTNHRVRLFVTRSQYKKTIHSIHLATEKRS